jgi:hypothetical protein
MAHISRKDRSVNEPPQTFSDSRILDVLMNLLNTGRVTTEPLKTTIGQHPELVGSETQYWLSVLAQAQEMPEARASVNDLARILGRLQTESLDAVFSDEGNRTLRLAARHAGSATASEAGKFSRVAQGAEGGVSGGTTIASFLAVPCRVVARLRAISVAERSQPYGRDVLNPHATSDSIPDYLFRGESGVFGTTCSSMARLSGSGRALEDVASIRDKLVEKLGEKCGLTPPQALGYLQHYGYPTEYLDVTSDVSVAASFASRLRVGDSGAVCIVPTKPLQERGSLIDLRRHPLAPRPRLQSAFAMHIPEYPDLKSAATRRALQTIWMEFQFTDLDAARFVPEFALLDARSDQVAGLIWLLINDCAKFSDEAASLLSMRIDPAPAFSVAGSDGEMVLVSEDDGSPDEAMSDKDFRDSAYKCWSDAFAAFERHPLPPELEQTVQNTEIPPGAILRILTSNAIGRIKARVE